MRTVGLATACAAIASVVVGCGPVVDGTAKPAPNLKPRPLSGQIVTELLQARAQAGGELGDVREAG